MTKFHTSFLLLAALAALTGCVTVENRDGLNPPVALCSHLRATIGRPDNIPVGPSVLKVGRSDGSVVVKEWAYTGISADVIDMALRSAVTEGGLKKVHYADYEQTSYLGFVTVFNLVAYGE